MNVAVVQSQRTWAWVTATVLASLIIPGAGFVIAAVSRHPKYRATSPRLVVLLIAASIVLAVQIIGLAAWQPSFLDVGPSSILE